MKETKASENRAYKVTLILLLGLAAFTTAVKELNRLHQVVSSVHGFTRQWRGTDVVAPNEKSISTQETISTNASCPNERASSIISVTDSDMSGLIAAASDGFVESMDYETISDPEVGARVDLFAGKKVSRNVPQLPRGKFVSARNLRQEVSSIRPVSNLPAHFEYKTLDRTVRLELSMSMVNSIKAESFENHLPPDVVQGLLKINRKHSQDKAETRRRELQIKKLERNISSRRAS